MLTEQIFFYRTELCVIIFELYQFRFGFSFFWNTQYIERNLALTYMYLIWANLLFNKETPNSVQIRSNMVFNKGFKIITHIMAAYY